MTILRGFLIIAISTALCAIIGAGTGYTLGTFAPAFYRTLFRNGNAPTFDPVQMGLGLGLTQGLVVGCVVVLAVAWYNSRRVVVIPAESDRESSSRLPSIRSEAIRPSEPSGM
jgi:hypothetical protein